MKTPRSASKEKASHSRISNPAIMFLGAEPSRMACSCRPRSTWVISPGCSQGRFRKRPGKCRPNKFSPQKPLRLHSRRNFVDFRVNSRKHRVSPAAQERVAPKSAVLHTMGRALGVMALLVAPLNLAGQDVSPPPQASQQVPAPAAGGDI